MSGSSSPFSDLPLELLDTILSNLDLVDLLHLYDSNSFTRDSTIKVLSQRWSQNLPKPVDAFLERYLSYSPIQRELLCQIVGGTATHCEISSPLRTWGY
jgi:hypothetical protein